MSLSQLKIIHSWLEMDISSDPLHLVCYVPSQSDHEFVKMRLSPSQQKPLTPHWFKASFMALPHIPT